MELPAYPQTRDNAMVLIIGRSLLISAISRFFSTIELFNALEQEKVKGKAGQIAETLVASTC